MWIKTEQGIAVNLDNVTYCSWTKTADADWEVFARFNNGVRMELCHVKTYEQAVTICSDIWARVGTNQKYMYILDGKVRT